MGTSIFSLLKTMTMAIAVVAVIALSHSVAKADEVTVAGYTNGCFGGGCVAPNTSAYQSASLLGLSYGNATFSNTTVGGFLAYGGNPQVVPGPQNLNNLGSFTLASSTAIYTGNSFTLRVTFTLPTGINGSSTSLFTATLTGAVSSTGNGGVMLDFNNTPILFTFSNASASGSFVGVAGAARRRFKGRS